MLATATAQADTPNQGPASPPQVRVEYTNVEDFLVDYTSNETIGGMFIKTDYPMEAVRVTLRIQLLADGGLWMLRQRFGGPCRARWPRP